MTFLLPAAAVLICVAIWVAALQITHVPRDNLISAAIRENRNRAIAYDHFVAGILDHADSAAQHPERLYRERGLMVAIVTTALAMVVLLRVDLPALHRLVTPTAPVQQR